MNLPTNGDVIPDRCCSGHNWTVLDVTQFSVWGLCDNPQCPERCCPDDPECPYNRMRTISLEDWSEEGETMSEQIGLAVTSEPHTDPQTMIEELQWELASQREAWLQIVADKDTEINRLTNAGLECAYGETMATDEAAEWVGLAALHDAKVKQLEAANEFLRGWLRGELTLADADIDAEMQRRRPQP